MWRDPLPELRSPVILGIETSCDETAAALVTRDGEIRANVVASQAELHARFGGVVPEVASRRHLELVAPVVREALDEADATLDDVELVAVDARARADRRAARRRSRRRRRSRGRAGCRSCRSTTCTATSRRSSSSPTRSSRRSSACSRAAATRSCSTSRPRAATERSGRRSTTRPARRSTRARGCSGSATRAARRSTGSPREGDPEAFAFPVARVAGLDFSFSGVKTALLYAVARPRRRTSSNERRADLAASYQRAIVRALVERDARRGGAARARADRRRRRRRRQLRAPGRARRRRARAARAVHRQRRDDRLGRRATASRPSRRPISTSMRMPLRRLPHRLARWSAARSSPAPSSPPRGSASKPRAAAVPPESWQGLVGQPARATSRSGSA